MNLIFFPVEPMYFARLLLFFLLDVALLTTSYSQCFQNTTDPANFQLYPTDISPRGIILADLNNDNRVDVATVSQIQNTISIRYNNQSGQFSAPTSFTVGAIPVTLVAADFNGDSRIDLATGNSGGTVSILLNSGSGVTGVSGVYEGLTGLQTIIAGDFNNDGQIDLALSSDGVNGYRILISAGDGTFSPRPTQPIPNGGSWVTASDFDQDGLLDIAIANYSIPNSSITVFHNTGSGDFTAINSYSVTSGSTVISAGDLNGDKYPDLVVGSFPNDAIDILLNTGTGQFKLVHTETNVSAPRAIVIRDVNGDNKPDLVMPHWKASYVSVWLNTGNATFQRGATYQTGTSPMDVAVADINGDGLPDLAASNKFNNTFAILINRGQGQFGSASIISTPAGINTSTAGDINNDGLADLIVTRDDTVALYNKALLFYINQGKGKFSAPSYQSVGVVVQDLLTGDLNNDGWTDILSTDHNNNSITVLLNAKTTKGSFLPPVHYSTGGGSQPPRSVLSDVNGDGFLDVLTQITGPSWTGILTFLNKGDGTLTAPTMLTVNLSNFFLSDLTNDGKPDLVVLTSVDQPSVRVYINQGNAQFSAPTGYSIARDIGTGVSVDVNFDGYADLIIATLNFTAILLNKGDGTFRDYQTLFTDPSVGNFKLKDLNDDGYLDLVGIKVLDQDVYKYELWVSLNTGNGGFAQPLNYPIGTFSLKTDVMDFDGDGRLDIAALSTAGLWIWYNCTPAIGYGFVSLKSGLWNDPGVWSHNRVPSNTDRILLRHTVTLPANYTGQAIRIGFDIDGRLKYDSNTTLKLRN